MTLYNTSKDIYDFLSFVVFFTASTDQVTVETVVENITINEGGIGTVGVLHNHFYITGNYKIIVLIIYFCSLNRVFPYSNFSNTNVAVFHKNYNMLPSVGFEPGS